MENDNHDDENDDDELNTRGMTLQPLPRYEHDTHAATEADSSRSIRHQM